MLAEPPLSQSLSSRWQAADDPLQLGKLGGTTRLAVGSDKLSTLRLAR